MATLAGCAGQGSRAAEPEERRVVQRVPLADIDLPLRLPGGAVLAAAWQLRSTLPISGLSAMALSGERLMLATDNGDLFQTSCPVPQSLGACGRDWRFDGRLVARGAPRADLEALAIRPDGSIVLGLENRPRLALLAGNAATHYRIVHFDAAPDLSFLPRNDGPEATTALPDGRLIVIPEGGVDDEGRALVLLQDAAGGWHRHKLELPVAGLLPTEAAVAGADLFILLRGVSLLSGWHCAVLSLPLTSLRSSDLLLTQPQLIATLHDARFTDNFEAMAARQLPDGSYSLLIGSDDNGLFLQRSLLLELKWMPAPMADRKLPSEGS